MTQGTVREQIMIRAFKDAAFRQEVRNNPRAVLARDYQLQIPETVSIRVIEDTEETFTLVLPPSQASVQELSDAELEAVAGGLPITTVTFNAHCIPSLICK